MAEVEAMGLIDDIVEKISIIEEKQTEIEENGMYIGNIVGNNDCVDSMLMLKPPPPVPEWKEEKVAVTNEEEQKTMVISELDPFPTKLAVTKVAVTNEEEKKLAVKSQAVVIDNKLEDSILGSTKKLAVTISPEELAVTEEPKLETVQLPGLEPAPLQRRFTLREYLASIGTSTEPTPSETKEDEEQEVDLDKELSRLKLENKEETKRNYDEELADMDDFDSMLLTISPQAPRARPTSTALELSSLDSLLDQFSNELNDL